MRSGLQALANVTSQGADVGTFRAHDTNGEEHFLFVKTQDLYLVNHQESRFELHLFALAGKLIGSFPIDLNGRESRRCLPLFSLKERYRPVDQLAGNMLRRVSLIDLFLKIIRGCRGT